MSKKKTKSNTSIKTKTIIRENKLSSMSRVIHITMRINWKDLLFLADRSFRLKDKIVP